MATLQEYIDVAPTVMGIGEFSLVAIENKLAAIPDPPAPPTPPTITRAKVISIFNTVFEFHSAIVGIQAAGGIKKIAKAVNLWSSQVVLIIRELAAMNALYDSEQVRSVLAGEVKKAKKK